jgi:hypothetical protein
MAVERRLEADLKHCDHHGLDLHHHATASGAALGLGSEAEAVLRPNPCSPLS